MGELRDNGVRAPSVAGVFYPAHPAVLAETVARFLDDAPRSGRAPRAVIAPHAGYVYSGRVAGRAFATLVGSRQRVRRAVIIGPSHFVAFAGIAAPTARIFRTPLGDVLVDREAVRTVLEFPQVVAADEPHRREHAIEVELPFLQTVLDDFTLVPLVVGAAAPGAVAEVIARLWDNETLIVVSSDLSHYLAYEPARSLDLSTAAAIERYDAAALGPDKACGYLAIAGLLIEAERRGLAVERLALLNSGDTAARKDSVVGYGAWALHET
jgi:AmmeMemoRadiSam system protein B